MGKIISPPNDQIGSIIGDLLGKKVTVAASDAEAVGSHAGLFRFRDDTLGMVAVGDAAAVAYAGSALTMIPKGVADEAAAAGAPTEMQVDCFQEVLNVVSQAWNLAGGDHIRLVGMKPVAGLDGDATALMSSGSIKHHVTIDVATYGQGVISFYGNG